MELIEKKRMYEQDIAKCIAILAVIALHTISRNASFAPPIALALGYIMTFFFIMSGYNYKPGKSSYIKNIKKRAQQLLIPLLIYWVALYIFMGAYCMIKDGTDISDILRSMGMAMLSRSGADLFGITLENNPITVYRVAWFIQYMFTGFLIFYAIADYTVANMKRFISVITGLLCITATLGALEIRLPWGIDCAPAVAAMMLIGTMFGKHRFLSEQPEKKIWTYINVAAAYAIIISVGISYPLAGQFMGGRLVNRYGFWEVFISVLIGTLGTYALVNICKPIAKLQYASKPMVWIGQNTFAILLLHLTFAKVIRDILDASPVGSIKISETMPWDDIIVFVLTTVTTCLYIYFLGKIKEKIKRKKA